MKIATKLILTYFLISALVIVLGIISLYQFSQLSEPISNEIPLQISELNTKSDLDAHAQLIRYYDEVLTQSARNYAFTLDTKWNQRYFDTVPLLDDVINYSIEYGDEKEKQFFQNVHLANTALIEMETKAILFADEGNPEQAIAILESNEYWTQKTIYEQGLRDYVYSRGLDYDEALISSSLTLEQVTNDTEDILNFGTSIVLVFVICAITVSVFLGFLIPKLITKPIKKLQNATEQIIQGNFDIKTARNSQDDLGQLSRNFQNMIETLKDTTNVKEQLTIQQNLRKALEESSIVSIIDKNGKITYVNDKFCQVSKYTKNELIGKRQDILRSRKIHPPGFYKDLWTTISSGKIWHGEICNTAKDGTLFWNDTTVIPFLDKNGQILEYVSIRNNITEQKNLTDRLVRAERFSAIGELSARISHDIRNPLAIIKSEFELLKLQKQIDENDFRRIDTSINRITHQLDDVLEYLRDTPLVYSKFNLTELVTEVIDTLQIPSNVKITIKDDEIFMIGDKDKINIILVNLIFNSIQALEDGGDIDIILSKTNSEIVIQIRDSGIGITIKPIEAIFDPLTTSKQKGTGLGLASVKNLVEQHGGMISVKNNPTTFTIKIPQKEDKSE